MLNTVIEACVQNKCCHMLGVGGGGACHKVVSKILKKNSTEIYYTCKYKYIQKPFVYTYKFFAR